MGTSVIKDLIREIRGTFGRFFAIFAIVAIGVAFFAGITASSGDMKNSSDAYYDEYNMSDLRLLSSLGLNEDDIEAVRDVEGVKSVCPTYSCDAVVKIGAIEAAVHIISVPEDTESDNGDYINRLRIKEGRLPENEGECVLRYEDTRENFNVGDVITLSSGNDEDLTETLNNTELTVVGIVYSPYYVSYELGTTDVGSGNINYIVYMCESEFKSEYYTELFATVEGASELDTYSSEYEELVDEVADRIEEISDDRLTARKSEINEIFDEKVQEAISQAKAVVYANVVESLTEQYSRYYVGMDVSALIEPYIQPAYEAALANYDFTYIEEQSKADFESKYGSPDDWEWYELTRQEQYSYKDYESSTERMSAIATVFPLFFIIVAGLVCLTTMTRMIAEERGVIGTYKALGYSKSVIAFKYIAYAFIASILGGGVGCVIGLRLFPMIIYDAWNIIYQLPSITYDDHVVLAIVAIASLVLVTLLATVISCYGELGESPSALMRPKSPKSGKKILIEHVGFIWKRFSFTMKVTLRNLFLYKNRFFMTVVGVAGCTALILAGFGIKNSIQSLIANQYGELIHYNSIFTFTDEVSQEEIDAISANLKEDEYIESFFVDCGYSDDATGNGDTETVQYVVVSDEDTFSEYMTLRDRKSHEAIELSDDGLVITEKLSKDFDVEVGDEITVVSVDGKEVSAVVSDISEMYVGHYVYMSSTYYEEIFGATPANNRVLVKTNEDVSDDDIESYVGDEYLSRSYVKGVTFVTANINRFENMIQSLDLVTWVLIISAGLLAFVVLYNLTNVNISERRREIATIKVLGFYDPEVGIYVYRENMFLTIIGGAFGLVFGRLLHMYIMLTVEMGEVMFGYVIKTQSYAYAFLITLVFAIIVNLSMYRSLKKLPMVESLKSVE